jgi:hypothetical protein
VKLGFTFKEDTMKLSAPKKWVWWLSLILALIGVVGQMDVIPALQPLAFFVLLVGFILLALANLLKGL